MTPKQISHASPLSLDTDSMLHTTSLEVVKSLACLLVCLNVRVAHPPLVKSMVLFFTIVLVVSAWEVCWACTQYQIMVVYSSMHVVGNTPAHKSKQDAFIVYLLWSVPFHHEITGLFLIQFVVTEAILNPPLQRLILITLQSYWIWYLVCTLWIFLATNSVVDESEMITSSR